MRRRAVSAKELAYYRTHILEALRDDGVVCLECGIFYKELANHLRKHGLTTADYRAKWGYNRTTALITPARHEALRQRALAWNLAALSPRGSIQKAMEAGRGPKPPSRLETRLSARAAVRARMAAGWHPSAPPKKVDDDTLRALVGEGLTLRQIEVRLGLSYSGLHARIRALGLTSPAIASFQLKATDAELLALRRSGLWTSEIAARTGMMADAVRKRLLRLRGRGVPVRPPAGPRPNARRRVSDEQLLALAQAGLRQREIAAQVGLSKGGLEKRLHDLRRRGLLPAVPTPARGRAGQPPPLVDS